MCSSCPNEKVLADVCPQLSLMLLNSTILIICFNSEFHAQKQD